MPSFDVVSKIDMQELDNALNQAKKEVGSRYDFQGTGTTLELAADQKSIVITSDDEMHIEAARSVLYTKLAKRGVSLRSIETGKIEPAAGSNVKQTVTLVQGIPVEKAKKLVQVVKEAKLKAQASIQGDALRVTSKSKDELQEVMRLLRGQQESQAIDLQFNNFRD